MMPSFRDTEWGNVPLAKMPSMLGAQSGVMNTASQINHALDLITTSGLFPGCTKLAALVTLASRSLTFEYTRAIVMPMLPFAALYAPNFMVRRNNNAKGVWMPEVDLDRPLEPVVLVSPPDTGPPPPMFAKPRTEAAFRSTCSCTFLFQRLDVNIDKRRLVQMHPTAMECPESASVLILRAQLNFRYAQAPDEETAPFDVLRLVTPNDEFVAMKVIAAMDVAAQSYEQRLVAAQRVKLRKAASRTARSKQA